MRFEKQAKRCEVYMGNTCVLHLSVKDVVRSMEGNMLMIEDIHGQVYEVAVQNVILYYGSGDDK